MALFPKKLFLEPKDQEVISMMEDAYESSLNENQDFRNEASIDARFEAGDQSVYMDFYDDGNVNKPPLHVFNRIRRIVNTQDGYQRKNRKSIIATPIKKEDEKTASQFTAILLWLTQREAILEKISDCNRSALISGLCLAQFSIDYTKDPVSGDIKMQVCPYNTFIIDPFWKNHDLSDCNYIWKRSALTKDECINLFPDKKSVIEDLEKSSGPNDDNFPLMPENNYRDRGDLLDYDEFYYRSYRKQKFLVDVETGETSEWKYSDEALNAFLDRHSELEVINQQVPTVKLAIVVQGEVLYNDVNPLNIDDYPFIPFTAHFRPDLQGMSQRFQSVVRGLRNIQYLYNLRRSVELSMVSTRPTNTLKVKDGALVNLSHAYQIGEGGVLLLDKEAQMTDVEAMPSVQIPPSFFQLSDNLSQEMQDEAGLSDEAFGTAEGDTSGFQTMMRQLAAVTNQQGQFDSLDKSQKLIGDLLIKLIQNNFAYGKINKILNESPTDQFKDEYFGEYSCVVEDGINTATQRQMEYTQLVYLKSTGEPIPSKSIIRASTLQNKEELIKDIEEQQKAEQEMMQKKEAAAMKQIEMESELVHARALGDRARGLERISRISENQTLSDVHKSEAAENRTDAALNVIKAAQEIKNMDLQFLQQKLDIVNNVKMVEAESAEQKANQTEAVDRLKATALKEELIYGQNQQVQQDPMQQMQQNPMQEYDNDGQ